MKKTIALAVAAVLSLGAAGFAAASGRPHDLPKGKPSTNPPSWSGAANNANAGKHSGH